MDAFFVHQPLLFEQNTISIRSMCLPAAGSIMAGSSLPAMMNILAAAGAVSSVQTAAQRRTREAG